MNINNSMNNNNGMNINNGINNMNCMNNNNGMNIINGMNNNMQAFNKKIIYFYTAFTYELIATEIEIDYTYILCKKRK